MGGHFFDQDHVIGYYLVSIAFHVIAGVFLFLLAWRHRLWSFGIIWFLGNLAIASSFVPLEIIFEHRLYLPAIMLIPSLLASARGFNRRRLS